MQITSTTGKHTDFHTFFVLKKKDGCSGNYGSKQTQQLDPLTGVQPFIFGGVSMIKTAEICGLGWWLWVAGVLGFYGYPHEKSTDPNPPTQTPTFNTAKASEKLPTTQEENGASSSPTNFFKVLC